MNDEKLEIIRGSGNVFRDFGLADADLLQMKSIVAAAVIRALHEQALTVRKAQAITGIAAADFSRIRQADLDRFTLDRLVTIAGRLGAKVRLTVGRPRVTNRRRLGALPSTAALEKQKNTTVARGKLKWTRNHEELRRD
jgi:predicted XRE-type DNA-binding protein